MTRDPCRHCSYQAWCRVHSAHSPCRPADGGFQGLGSSAHRRGNRPLHSCHRIPSASPLGHRLCQCYRNWCRRCLCASWQSGIGRWGSSGIPRPWFLARHTASAAPVMLRLTSTASSVLSRCTSTQGRHPLPRRASSAGGVASPAGRLGVVAGRLELAAGTGCAGPWRGPWGGGAHRRGVRDSSPGKQWPALLCDGIPPQPV
jgi:hypothetical protein